MSNSKGDSIMRLVAIEFCQENMELARTIYNQDGRPLLRQGTTLTGNIIERLKKYGVSTLYVEDELSEGIEVEESIPVELRIEAESTVRQSFQEVICHAKGSNLLGHSKMVKRFTSVFNEIFNYIKKNKTALNLISSVHVNDHYVYSHSLNVTIYTTQLALNTKLKNDHVRQLGVGTLMHDIGKSLIPSKILNKPGQLTDEEYEIVKKHTELGFEFLRKQHEIPLLAAHCAYQHHERLDGSGYPRGLKGDEIHPFAKIIAVADVFDAVTTNRVYRKAMLPHQGLEILYGGSGTQFDAQLIKRFRDNVAIYPTGVTVTLSTGETGIVSHYNYKTAGRPKVRIIRDRDQAPVQQPHEIDLSKTLNVQITGCEAIL